MSTAFRAVPNGTIRLTAATVPGAAPLLAGLPMGGGCNVLIQNRGTVPVQVEFGAKSGMDLPVLPSANGPAGGARSIPVGGMAVVRLQQGERHVAVAVASGTPDVEFTVGEGGDGLAIGGGSASGGASGPVEAAAFTTTNTTGIGASSVQVSAAYPGGKRSVLNDGTVALRLVSSAGITSGGLLLAVGGAYVIDGQNPLSAAIFAYAPTGTGSVSEIRQ